MNLVGGPRAAVKGEVWARVTGVSVCSACRLGDRRALEGEAPNCSHNDFTRLVQSVDFQEPAWMRPLGEGSLSAVEGRMLSVGAWKGGGGSLHQKLQGSGETAGSPSFWGVMPSNTSAPSPFMSELQGLGSISITRTVSCQCKKGSLNRQRPSGIYYRAMRTEERCSAIRSHKALGNDAELEWFGA